MQTDDFVGLMWEEFYAQYSDYVRLREQFERLQVERKNIEKSLKLFRRLSAEQFNDHDDKIGDALG